MKLKRIFFLLVIFPAILVIICCRKKDKEYIPAVPVDFYLYTTDPSFFNLQVVGGWEYITGGSRGILVYRASNEEFAAFDRHCPYQPENSCGQVQVINTNVSAIDSCCGSQFSIIDGSILNGPASMPLKRYQATFDGAVLHIYN